MTPEEERILKDFVDRLHQQFVSAISEGRQMDLATVQKLADGRIYTGEDAKEIGLVDRIGNLEDAIDWAGELAGIEGDIIPVYPPPKKLSIMRLLTESVLEDLIGRVTHQAMTAEYRYTPSQP